MSVQPKQKTPKLDPQLVNQLLSGRKTAGEIEDLLKDLRKAFIESALDGELTHLLGYEKHDASGRNRATPATALPERESRLRTPKSKFRSRVTATAISSRN
jgi:transposase-like protein